MSKAILILVLVGLLLAGCANDPAVQGWNDKKDAVQSVLDKVDDASNPKEKKEMACEKEAKISAPVTWKNLSAMFGVSEKLLKKANPKHDLAIGSTVCIPFKDGRTVASN